MDGQTLKSQLGLTNFDYVYIQKVLGLSYKIYIISINSRYPSKFIPYKILKNSQVADIFLAKSNSIGGNLRLTPPIELDMFRGKIQNNSIIFIRDVSGEQFIDKGMYENKVQNVYDITKKVRNAS